MKVAKLTAQQVLHPSSCWLHPAVTFLVPHSPPYPSLLLDCLLPHREGRGERRMLIFLLHAWTALHPRGSWCTAVWLYEEKTLFQPQLSFTEGFALDTQPQAWIKERAILKDTLKSLLWVCVCNKGICETLQIEKCSEIFGSSHSRVLVAGPYSLGNNSAATSLGSQWSSQITAQAATRQAVSSANLRWGRCHTMGTAACKNK